MSEKGKDMTDREKQLQSAPVHHASCAPGYCVTGPANEPIFFLFRSKVGQNVRFLFFFCAVGFPLEEEQQRSDQIRSNRWALPVLGSFLRPSEPRCFVKEKKKNKMK